MTENTAVTPAAVPWPAIVVIAVMKAIVVTTAPPTTDLCLWIVMNFDTAGSCSKASSRDWRQWIWAAMPLAVVAVAVEGGADPTRLDLTTLELDCIDDWIKSY